MVLDHNNNNVDDLIGDYYRDRVSNSVDDSNHQYMSSVDDMSTGNNTSTTNVLVS